MHLPHIHGPFHHKSDVKNDNNESTPDSTPKKEKKHTTLKKFTKKLHLPHHNHDAIKNQKGMLANAMCTIAMEPFQLSGEIEDFENSHRFYDKLEDPPRQENMCGVESNDSQIQPLTYKAYPPLLKILPPTPDQSQNPFVCPSPFDISHNNKPLFKTNNNFAALLASSSPPDHHRSSSDLVSTAVSNNTSDDRTASPAKQQPLPTGHARTESLSMKMSQSPKVGDGSNNNSLTGKDINNGVCRRSSDSDLSITPKGMFDDFFIWFKEIVFEKFKN